MAVHNHLPTFAAVGAGDVEQAAEQIQADVRRQQFEPQIAPTSLQGGHPVGCHADTGPWAPVDRHPCRDILDAGRGCDIGECAIVVAIKIVAAEIVGDIQVLVAVVVEILPSRGQTEPRVVLVQPRFLGDIDKTEFPFVSQQVVSTAVVRVMVRQGKR